jgi:hypothetical protein
VPVLLTGLQVKGREPRGKRIIVCSLVNILQELTDIAEVECFFNNDWRVT